jgi:hypothetical protein
MAASRLTIKNMALAEVPAQRIDDENETSVEAEACAAAYPEALAYLLEAYDWDFNISRAVLAVIANDRAHEWTYAYALPEGLLTPRIVLPFGADAVTGSVPDYSVAGKLRGFETIVPFRINGSTIYTNQQNAILEYSNDAPLEATFPAWFARALALELAARVVMPIRKDSKRQGELIRMAEVARERAKAEDMNRDPESIRDFIPEVQLARMGLLPWQ